LERIRETRLDSTDALKSKAIGTDEKRSKTSLNGFRVIVYGGTQVKTSVVDVGSVGVGREEGMGIAERVVHDWDTLNLFQRLVLGEGGGCGLDLSHDGRWGKGMEEGSVICGRPKRF